MPGRAQEEATALHNSTCGVLMWFNSSFDGPRRPPAADDAVTEIQTCFFVRLYAF